MLAWARLRFVAAVRSEGSDPAAPVRARAPGSSGFDVASGAGAAGFSDSGAGSEPGAVWFCGAGAGGVAESSGFGATSGATGFSGFRRRLRFRFTRAIACALGDPLLLARLALRSRFRGGDRRCRDMRPREIRCKPDRPVDIAILRRPGRSALPPAVFGEPPAATTHSATFPPRSKISSSSFSP